MDRRRISKRLNVPIARCPNAITMPEKPARAMANRRTSTPPATIQRVRFGAKASLAGIEGDGEVAFQ